MSKDLDAQLVTGEEGENMFTEALKDMNEDIQGEEPTFNGMPTNIPYEKIYNDEGVLANPITKNVPYRTTFMNRRTRKALIREATRNPKNNKKGVRMVVTKVGKSFVKTRITRQNIEKGFEKDSVGSDGYLVIGTKKRKARTITHNQIQ